MEPLRTKIKTGIALFEPAPIQQFEERVYYPLSPAQEVFFTFQRMFPDFTAYNMTGVLEMEGKPDIARFESSFIKVIERHESLRTSFHLLDGEPVQKVHTEVPFKLEYYHLEELVVDNLEELEEDEPITIIMRRFKRSFDLSKAPLIRVGLVEEAENNYLLVVDMHHIISDVISTGIFIRDFLSFFEGSEFQLPDLVFQYKDYVLWRRKKGTTPLPPINEIKSHLSSGEEMLNLPLDYIRPAANNYEGKNLRFHLDSETVKSIYQLATRLDVTLYILLMGVFTVFLSRLSGKDEIRIGSPVDGRTHSNWNNIIGLFLDNLAITNKPAGEKLFPDFMHDVKSNVLNAFEKQTFCSQQPADSYNVMFVFQQKEIPNIEIEGLKLNLYIFEKSASKLDLTLYCEEREQQLYFCFEYSIQLFKESTIKRFNRYFLAIITELLQNPNRKISEIEMVSEEERQRILYDFNSTSSPYPWNKTISRVFEDQVEKRPENTAVIKVLCHLPFDQSTLTYQELNKKANRLARVLNSRGIHQGSVVGIMLERSLDLTAAILGVIKCGGTYIPIDPEYPDSRIRYMLEQTEASLLITDSAIASSKSQSSIFDIVDHMLMDSLANRMQGIPYENLENSARPDDLIYIVFTSGSTGRPRGTGAYHQGVMNLMYWFIKEFGLHSGDRNLLITSFSFDLTQKNIYAPLMTGGTLCIPAFNFFEPIAILREIRENWVSWINATPSMFYKLVECVMIGKKRQLLSSLRYVFLGGEAMSLIPLIEWMQTEHCNAQLVNMYGTSECTDISTSYRILEPARFLKEPVPIGKPLSNVQLYILDNSFRLLPVGVPGEIFIGGECLGSGYIKDTETTQKKFIYHSFSPGESEEKLYRSGDLAKWLETGDIEFLGRIDNHIKIRGYRIELGEIEFNLINHPAVKEAVVTLKSTGSDRQSLCAYIVPTSMDTFDANELSSYLALHLPSYMVPLHLVPIPFIPLTPNGKADRTALPEPEQEISTDTSPLRSEIDRKVAAVFYEALTGKNDFDEAQKKGFPGMGIDDNFFQFGGNSLNAASLLSKIQRDFSLEISFNELFKTPTIRGISDYITSEKKNHRPLYGIHRN